jgi:hypothetical protein
MTNMNPYSSPQEPTFLPEDMHVCPVCGTVTDGLKCREVVVGCIFVIAFVQIRTAVYVACPACIRRIVWRCCFKNILPANLLWPFYILPRTLIQVLCTYIPGSSKLPGE